jgi:hypothetical protein
MKSKRVAVIAVLILGGVCALRLGYAQENTASAVTAKSKSTKPPKTKIDTFKGEVIRMNTTSIIVRDPKNSYLVRTFTFSPDLTKKLQSLIERGGYQPGDTVEVHYQDGTSVAEIIKGKPSKAY